MKTAILALMLLPAACSTPRVLDRNGRGQEPAPVTVPGLAGAPYIQANWKERLTQPYVFLEHRGDYRRMGEVMRHLFSEAEALGLLPDGAPFALFFDDPGRVPLAGLRARACFPVPDRPARLGQLQYDLLPRAMVVYARVPGAYPDVARSYPALFSYLSELGWQQGGPVREVYLVNPVEAASFDELVTEVQIPWAARGE